MKRLAISVIAIAVSCIGVAAVADDDKPGIPDEIIKTMDSFVGAWKTSGKVGDKTQSGGITLRWSRMKNGKKVCLVGQYSFTTGDETMTGTNIVGWNSAKKCIEDRGFNDLGGNGTLYWSPKSENLLKGEFVHFKDGKEIHATADLVKKGDAEFVLESVTDDGEVSRIVYKKAERKQRRAKD